MTAPAAPAAASITSLTPGVFDDLAGAAFDSGLPPPADLPRARRRRDIAELYAAAQPRPRLATDATGWESIDAFGPEAGRAVR